ncbi:natural killer cell receptor 2B4-like [Porphyrio hochstetteri]
MGSGSRAPSPAMEHLLGMRSPCSPLSALGPPKCQDRAVAVDGDLSLQLEKPPREWDKIQWRWSLDGGQGRQVILVVERNKPKFSKGSFVGRATFQEDTLSLQISPVRVTDSGLYWAEFESSSRVVSVPQFFCVSVWEPVNLPHLDTHILHQDNGWCNISLLCTHASAGNVSYDWSCTGDALGAPEHQPQLQLRVPEDTDPPTVCSCNVSNPVSWSTASTNVTALCHPAPSGLFGILSLWEEAVILAGVLAILGVILVFCYCWRRRRRAPPGEHDEQALTVYEEVGKTQTSRVPHGTSEAAVGGNTVYAVITPKAQGRRCPPDPQSCTVYSSIQPIGMSPSLRRKKLHPALTSTAYVESTGGSRRWCSPLQTSSPVPGSHKFS